MDIWSRRRFVQGLLLSGCAGSLGAVRRRPPHHRVAIIGAGLAGLTCAHKLRQQGVEAMLYEAGGRAGGRVWTVPGPDGAPVDLGGEHIAREHMYIRALAAELDVALHPTGIRIEPLSASLKRALLASADAPYGANAASLLRDLSATDAGTLRWLTPLLTGVTVDQVALRWLALRAGPLLKKAVDLSDVLGLDFRIAGGAGRLVEALRAKLAPAGVLLGHQLVSIGEASHGLRLHFRTGDEDLEATASLVVLAVPFSLLGEDAGPARVHIDLPLQPEMAAALAQRSTYGALGKVFIRSDAKPARRQATALVLDAGTGVRSTLVGGLDGVSAIDRAKRASRSALGDGAVTAFDWDSDPLSRGGVFAVEAAHDTGPARYDFPTQSATGNLLLAGEHCATTFPGTMEGAVESGETAAEMAITWLNRRQSR